MTPIQRLWLRLTVGKRHSTSLLADAALERLAAASPIGTTHTELRQIDADMAAPWDRKETGERDMIRVVHLTDQLTGISAEVATRGRIPATHRIDEIGALRGRVAGLEPRAEYLLPEIDQLRARVLGPSPSSNATTATQPE